MQVFKKQDSLIKNIAYMGLMTAVNVIFVILTYFIPFLLFVLVFTLPLCSAIITYYCKKMYFPLYVIAVGTICFLIDPADTLFYVIPSLLTGFVFGISIEFKIPSIFILVFATLMQFGISLLTIPLINYVSQRDIVNDLATMFHLSNYQYLSYVKYSFIFFVSFAQIIITYLVMYSELEKFGLKINVLSKWKIIPSIMAISLSILIIPFAFLVPELSYILLYIATIFAFDSLVYFDYSKVKLMVIEFGISAFAIIFFFAGLYRLIPTPLGLLLLGILPLIIGVLGIVNYALFIHHNKGIMNN